MIGCDVVRDSYKHGSISINSGF